MTDSVFEEATTSTEDTETNTVFKIGDREYTPEDIQTKVTNQDSHIAKLEAENAEYRKKIDEYMDTLKTLQDESTTSKPTEGQSDTPTISPEEVAKVVQRQLEAHSSRTQQKSNLNKVDSALKDRFGGAEGGREAFLAKAQELNMEPKRLMELSAESPDAVLSWFEKPQQTGSTGSSTSGHNTTAVSSMEGNIVEGSYNWWTKLRQEDPGKYYSPEMTHKRMKDAERLGRDKFFGN